MNKDRKTRIKLIVSELKASNLKLEILLSEEDMAYSSMPENLQNSDKGMESEECIGVLEEAGEKLGDVIELLEDI